MTAYIKLAVESIGDELIMQGKRLNFNIYADKIR